MSSWLYWTSAALRIAPGLHYSNMGAATGLRACSREPVLASSHSLQAERVIGERHWSDGTIKWVLPLRLAAALCACNAPLLLRVHQRAAGPTLLHPGPCSYATPPSKSKLRSISSCLSGAYPTAPRTLFMCSLPHSNDLKHKLLSISSWLFRYLVKWRGLPYCEATYETEAELAATGQGHHVKEFQVGAAAPVTNRPLLKGRAEAATLYIIKSPFVEGAGRGCASRAPQERACSAPGTPAACWAGAQPGLIPAVDACRVSWATFLPTSGRPPAGQQQQVASMQVTQQQGEPPYVAHRSASGASWSLARRWTLSGACLRSRATARWMRSPTT